jgi:hypothetical protein
MLASTDIFDDCVDKKAEAMVAEPMVEEPMVAELIFAEAAVVKPKVM